MNSPLSFPLDTKTATLSVAPADSVPVFLVHGYKDDCRKMMRLAKYLRSTGRDARLCTIAPSQGKVGLDQLANQLKSQIDHVCPAEHPIDLVGFSMGGLICRYYLQRLSGLERTRRFVTISTPHRGSLLAWLVDNPACRQMRPGSAFLRDLASDAHRLNRTQFTSLWTPLDLMILPSNSSVIPEARCERLFCLAHPLMVFERRSLRAVEAALS